MSFAVSTNLNSLVAQRQLAQTTSQLGTAVERLSSGLRINGARDDAAGLAIAERMSGQIQGVNQAARNTNDAISLAQTADGALASISNNLQRIRELAVQSANGTNSATDRAALQAESAQLVSEIDRIASQTSFNGNHLLDGSFIGQPFQIGANRQQTVSAQPVAAMGADVLGQYNGFGLSDPGAITYGAASALTVTINGPGTVYNVGTVATDARAVAAALNAAAIPGLQAMGVDRSWSALSLSSMGTVDGTAVVTINGVSINVAYTAGAGAQALAARRQAVVEAINGQSTITGVTASYDYHGGVTLVNLDGRNVSVAYSAGTATGSAAGDLGLTLMNNSVSAVWVNYQSPTGSAVASVTVTGAGIATPTPMVVGSMGTAVRTMDISTSTGARSAIDTVDVALGTVSAARASMGALQNRLQSAIANLQTSAENMSASRSRIVDADFAQEAANLSRAQILQQAGTAMVTQANQSPQTVLGLLRNV